MYPRPFAYRAPESLDEALHLLAARGDEAKVLSGGQSLLPLLKLRLLSPALIVDLGRIPGLDEVRCHGEEVEIGALARHSACCGDGRLRRELPWVADAVRRIGDRQVRNLGTVGGALAEADPAGDWPAVALALGGRLVARSVRGERRIAVADFFVDAYATVLDPDEVVVAVRLPRSLGRSGGCYVKLERRSGDFAVAGCAVQVTLAEGGACETAGIGLTGLGPTPLKAVAAERLLAGRPLSAERVQEAAEEIRGAVDPISDTRGSSAYKRTLAGIAFERALRAAVAAAARAGGAAPSP